MSERKEPTAAEAMFFYAIVKHTKNKADIDWNAVAVEQGFKNAEVAKVRFGQVKRKLGISGDASTPARATPKKAGTSSAGGTPTKVAKTPASRSGAKGKGKGKVKKEEQDGEDEAMTPEKAPKQESEDDEASAQIHAEMDNDADPF